MFSVFFSTTLHQILQNSIVFPFLNPWSGPQKNNQFRLNAIRPSLVGQGKLSEGSDELEMTTMPMLNGVITIAQYDIDAQDWASKISRSHLIH